MSKGLNRAQIIGYLGQDPDLNHTSDGTAVANFSVATNQHDRDEPEWHNCTAWGDLAEIVSEHLGKGECVFLEGPLRTNEWEDRDGNTRSTTEIHADEVIFFGSEGQKKGRDLDGKQAAEELYGGGEQKTSEPDDSLSF